MANIATNKPKYTKQNGTFSVLFSIVFGIIIVSGFVCCLYTYKQHNITQIILKEMTESHNEALTILNQKVEQAERDKKDYLKKVANPSKRNIQDMKNYITLRYSTIPDELVLIIAETTQKITEKHDVDFGLVVGLMEVESVFNPFAKSKADARGLLQIMYKIWGKTYDIKHPSDLHNIEYNVDIGVHILKHYLKKNNGNIRNALQNYNGSEGTAFSNKVFTALGKFTAYRNNSSTCD